LSGGRPAAKQRQKSCQRDLTAKQKIFRSGCSPDLFFMKYISAFFLVFVVIVIGLADNGSLPN
jgi:hypothetical protein